MPLTRYQNRYRVESTRNPHHDYSGSASYFITIIARYHRYHFEEISNGEMYLSESGQVVYRILKQIPKKFPGLTIDESILMPNHLHAILHIQKPDIAIHDQMDSIKSGGATGMRNPMNSEMALGKIIRYFKAKSTAEIRSNINPDFE